MALKFNPSKAAEMWDASRTGAALSEGIGAGVSIGGIGLEKGYEFGRGLLGYSPELQDEVLHNKDGTIATNEEGETLTLKGAASQAHKFGVSTKDWLKEKFSDNGDFSNSLSSLFGWAVNPSTSKKNTQKVSGTVDDTGTTPSQLTLRQWLKKDEARKRALEAQNIPFINTQ